ncbi:hypothetical protein [Macrococcus animalis]|uniref:hypothetical protein n=1 Tax=Macrococcus animalis TaxID=3395467 RepID=UPI0039BDB30C
MINVGNKVIWQSEEWEVCSIEEHIVELRRIEDGFGIGTKVDLKFLESNYFKQLYEQQKQRADELEKQLKNSEKMKDTHKTNVGYFKRVVRRQDKRWSELEEKVRNRYEYTTHNLVTWMHNKEEAKQWSAAKHELLMVMKEMHDLEEDGE